MADWFDRWRYGKQYGYKVLFRRQDRRPVGKVGVILADLGMPEEFEPQFYVDYLRHVFEFSLPRPLQSLVLVDRGIALIDPSNPLAREAFQPTQLVDMYGSYTNRAGRPYVECAVTWRPPGMKRDPSDHGYFLYTGDGPGGAPDVCQKTAAKVVGWYYGHLLPEKKVAWAYQCGLIYADVVAALRERRPTVECCHARYASMASLGNAVEKLLAAGCQTIIYQSYSSPVYSDFEEYGSALVAVHRLVAGRAKLICADQPGNQPAMRAAYVHLISDQLASIPASASVLLILSRHGHPFRRETMDLRAHEYRDPLEAEVRLAIQRWGGQAQVLWSDDEYADAYWDPKGRKRSTLAAHRFAIDNGFDYALEVPTDFVAENTDLMVLHALKKYVAYGDYDPHAPIAYPDWERPLVRTFHQGKTTGIYTGCLVGPYRKYVVEAVLGSLLAVLEA